MILWRSVRKVDASDIHSGAHERLYLTLRTAGGTQCADNFGSSQGTLLYAN
jgi:hypothetical protein